MQWVETGWYFRVTLDVQLTWRHATRFEQRQLKDWAYLCLCAHVKSSLIHEQPILSVMNYACPNWISAARSHIRKMQVLQSKCVRIATFVVTDTFTSITVLHISHTISEQKMRTSTQS